MEGLFPPGLEPGTFRVLGERDNHYTTQTDYVSWSYPNKKFLGDLMKRLR